MIVNHKITPVLKKVMLTATAVFALMQCSEEEIVPAVTAPEVEVANIEANAETLISSLTITGLYTNLSSAKNCNCNYTVPADQQIVDGAELGIKPGNTICLAAKTRYENLEFINMEGTEELPILIVNLGERTELADQSLTANSQDPY